MAIDLEALEDRNLRRQLTVYLKDSPSSRVRKAFFTGKPMTPLSVSDFGIHATVLNGLVEEAKLVGYVVDRTMIDRGDGGRPTTQHRITNPDAWDYDEALIRLAKARQGASKKAKAKRRTKSKTPDDAREEVLPIHVPAHPSKAKANGKALIHPGNLPFTYFNVGDHMLPIPALGAQVEVNILKKERDGTIRIGLMVEGVQWIADITDAALV